MSRRVQLVPTCLGLVFVSGVVIYGCSSEDNNSFGTNNTGSGKGGSTSAPATVSPGSGGYTPSFTTGNVARGGAVPQNTVAGVGGVTNATTTPGATAPLGTGGTTSVATATKAAGGAAVATTTAAVTNPNTGTTVTFAKGKAVGAMTGYAYVAMGAKDTVSDPTCGGAAIDASTPCKSGTTWAADDSLCMSGSVPAVAGTDYDSYWGESIGINATDPASGGLNQAHTSIAFTFTGTPTSGLRATAHVIGKSKEYCFEGVVSGTAIAFTKFNTACWDDSGTALAAADVAKIDKIALQVSAGKTAITVADLCISGITFK